MASSAKKMKVDEGPLPITLFVLEDMMVRSYSNGGQYGTTYVVSSNSEFKTITSVIVHEKHLAAIKPNRAYLLMKYLLLQDGTIKVSQNTMVMQTKTPHNLSREVIEAFINPPVIQELGRIASMNPKERVSIRGEVTRVSSIIHANETQRKIVTLSDGNASVEVKLWGELSTTCFEEGSTVRITCLHVDLYQNRRTLNSSGSTSVQIEDNEEDFRGTVDGVCFEESNSSILVGGEVVMCTTQQLSEVFPQGEYREDVKVKGKRKRSVVTSLELDEEKEEVEEDDDERLLGDVSDLIL
uniref:Uncharacterized protein LOC111115353 isoform X2 n=1 Tax=Crassostrea virginica TaxID=6565 RepID=A0A8B8C2G1_CRAVI|nr:uncharacterized protein LOC111115353 isoform X2 [Crassostrea virginica]